MRFTIANDTEEEHISSAGHSRCPYQKVSVGLESPSASEVDVGVTDTLDRTASPFASIVYMASVAALSAARHD